jgi:hypothetical protein
MVAPPMFSPLDDIPETPNLVKKAEQIEMPNALRSELESLERWAKANQAAAKKDGLKFWMLKVPTILLTSTASILTFYGLADLAIISGAVGSVLVLLDGVLHPGIMRNARYLAFYESREVQSSIATRWTAASLGGEASAKAAAIALINDIGREKARISGALKRVEAKQATV